MGKSIISRHRIIYIYYLLSMTQKIHKSEFTLPPSSRKIVDEWVCALGMVLILIKWINQKVASFESCDTTQLAILWQLLANSVHFYFFQFSTEENSYYTHFQHPYYTKQLWKLYILIKLDVWAGWAFCKCYFRYCFGYFWLFWLSAHFFDKRVLWEQNYYEQ